MANPHKGEVSFTVGNESYKLSFSADALAELEDALGMNVNAISGVMQDPEKFRLGTLRTLFWAGLLDHQDDTDMAGARKILKCLSVSEATELIGKAFTLAFPAAGEAQGDVGPQKPGSPPPDGTGPAS